MSFRSHKAQLRIRNNTGYDTRQLRRVIRLASPWCAQPDSILVRGGDLLFLTMFSLDQLGKDVAWPRVLNPQERYSGQRTRVAIDLPPYLCPTVSLLRCTHWLGSLHWVRPPDTLDYWNDIVSKVGLMLVAPTNPKPKDKSR